MQGACRIDLDGHRTAGVRVFAGRDRGKKVRDSSRLDELERECDTICVVVPEDVFSINSSFFLGMFGPSIARLGEIEFRRRFQFEGKSIARVYEAGIREATNPSSPFQSGKK
jgi:hypothetical protein